jgi:predicted transcriptional regulator
MRRLWIILLFFTLLIIPVYTVQGSDIVRPHVPPLNDTQKALTDSSGADSTITFWDLPLWLQTVIILQGIIAFLLSITIIPVIIGRLTEKNRSIKADDVFNYIIRHPGSTMSQISRDTKINRDTVKYHTYDLIADGLLTLKKVGKYARLYDKKLNATDLDRLITIYLSDEVNTQILFTILDKPGITNAELVKEISINKSSIHWHIEKFLIDGVITEYKDGVFRRYFITTAVEPIIKNYKG